MRLGTRPLSSAFVLWTECVRGRLSKSHVAMSWFLCTHRVCCKVLPTRHAYSSIVCKAMSVPLCPVREPWNTSSALSVYISVWSAALCVSACSCISTGLHARPRQQRLLGRDSRRTALPRVTNDKPIGTHHGTAHHQECIEPALVRC